MKGFPQLKEYLWMLIGSGGEDILQFKKKEDVKGGETEKEIKM